MAERVTIRALVSGRVQGVGFRARTQHRATALSVSRWTRNRTGGEVEALLSGSPAAVAGLLAASREGPRLAKVAQVDVLRPAGPPEGPFTIKHDRDN